MPEEPASSARLRRIGKALRELREEQGITLRTAGRRVERSSGSLSLIENGLQPLRLRDLKHILDVYEVPNGPLRTGLMTLADQSRQKGWWTALEGQLSPSALDYASLEWDADLIAITELGVIPGLLQTEEYTRAIMTLDITESAPAETERFVAYRMARQSILDRDQPPQLKVVIDESGLRRTFGGPEVMRAQLHHLLDRSHHDHITLQVLPFSRTPRGSLRQFMVLEIGRPNILGVVLVDNLHGRWILEDEADFAVYRSTFGHVSDGALAENDSRTLIHRLASEL